MTLLILCQLASSGMKPGSGSSSNFVRSGSSCKEFVKVGYPVHDGGSGPFCKEFVRVGYPVHDGGSGLF